jgi:hypothetical protein
MKIAIYVQDMRASGVVRTMIAMARRFAASDDSILLAGYNSGMFAAADIAPAPAAASSRAVASPMPLDAPVISTTLSIGWVMMLPS